MGEVMEEKDKTKRKIIWAERIIIGFIIINLMVFISVFADKCNSNINRPAKLFMSSAATINIMYIFPIYKVFGWDSPIAKPFCVVRNYLYNEGLKRIPEDDGEREQWWFVIRFTEYDRFVLPKVSKFVSIYDFTPTEKEFNKYLGFTEELYNHIYPLGTLKIQDKKLISRRYNMFIATIQTYSGGRYALMYKIAETQGHGYKYHYYKGEKDIEREKILVDLILKQREYIKKYEPEGWNYYRTKTVNYYSDDLSLFLSSSNIVDNELYKNKLSCDDKYLNIYGETRKILRKYISDTKLPVVARRAIDWASVGTTDDESKICSLCPDNKYLDLLRKDVKRDTRDRENSKRYDEMRMVGKDRNYKPKNTTVIRLH